MLPRHAECYHGQEMARTLQTQHLIRRSISFHRSRLGPWIFLLVFFSAALIAKGCLSSYPNPCEGISCGGHGSCVAYGKDAVCVCDPGYVAEGTTCVETQDPCEGITCSGHGTCSRTDTGETRCDCYPGYVNHGPIFCAPTPEQGVCNQTGWCWQHPTPQGNDLHEVWSIAKDDVWAVGSAGTLLHFDGQAWTRHDVDDEILFHGVWASGPDEVWVVGARNNHREGVVLRWDGNAWSSLDPPVTEGLYKVWGTASDDVWATGLGETLHWDGSTWSTWDVATSFWCSGFWGSAQDDVWLAPGWGPGVVLHWDGSDWDESRIDGGSITFNDVSGTSANDAWIAGIDYDSNHASILRWDGASWSETLWEPKFCPMGLWAAGTDNAWAAGFQYLNGAFRYSRIFHWNGLTWTEEESPTETGTTSIHGTSADDVWTVGYHGMMAQREPDGWSEVSRHHLYQIESVHGTSARDVWAVGGAFDENLDLAGGAVVHHDGDTWFEVHRLLDHHLLGVWSSNSAGVWAVGEKGAVIHSTGLG